MSPGQIQGALSKRHLYLRLPGGIWEPEEAAIVFQFSLKKKALGKAD